MHFIKGLLVATGGFFYVWLLTPFIGGSYEVMGVCYLCHVIGYYASRILSKLDAIAPSSKE